MIGLREQEPVRRISLSGGRYAANDRAPSFPGGGVLCRIHSIRQNATAPWQRNTVASRQLAPQNANNARPATTSTVTGRFPKPWRIVEIPNGFAVDDATGRQLGVFYGRTDPNTAGDTDFLMIDEAEQIAVDFVRLPELLKQTLARSEVATSPEDDKLTKLQTSRSPQRAPETSRLPRAAQLPAVTGLLEAVPHSIWSEPDECWSEPDEWRLRLRLLRCPLVISSLGILIARSTLRLHRKL